MPSEALSVWGGAGVGEGQLTGIIGGFERLGAGAEECARTGTSEKEATCSSWLALHLLSTFLSRQRFKKLLNSGDLSGEITKKNPK